MILNSLLFDREYYPNIKEVRRYLLDNQIDTRYAPYYTENYIHIKLVDVSKIKRLFKTIVYGRGIKAIISTSFDDVNAEFFGVQE